VLPRFSMPTQAIKQVSGRTSASVKMCISFLHSVEQKTTGGMHHGEAMHGCWCVLIGICYENVYDLLIKVGWFLPPPSPSVCYFLLWLSHFLLGLISMFCANAYNLSPKVSSFLLA
jgi:hypothetical protein